MKFISSLFLALLMTVSFSAKSQAQQQAVELPKPYQKFGDNTVHFNLFSSKLLTPSIAKASGFTRAADLALLNVALVKGKAHSGSPAKVTGYYKNLMQQQRQIEFREIKETNATYYIASFRFTNQDILHFNIDVQALDSDQVHNIQFSRKMYTDK